MFSSFFIYYFKLGLWDEINETKCGKIWQSIVTFWPKRIIGKRDQKRPPLSNATLTIEDAKAIKSTTN
jgi:hypothetical protein